MAQAMKPIHRTVMSQHKTGALSNSVTKLIEIMQPLKQSSGLFPCTAASSSGHSCVATEAVDHDLAILYLVLCFNRVLQRFYHGVPRL